MTPSHGASSAGKGGGVIGGGIVQNQGVREGPLEAEQPIQQRDSRTPDAGPRDVKAVPWGILDEPWFGRLPPELRKAIRSDARRRAPRGYEERLRRYFESID